MTLKQEVGIMCMQDGRGRIEVSPSRISPSGMVGVGTGRGIAFKLIYRGIETWVFASEEASL